jgi:type IV pilus assembly protein PilN
MIKINLLPKEAKKRVGIGERIALIVIVIALTCGAIGFTWNYLNTVIKDTQAEITKTQQRLDELKKVIAEIEALEQQQAALQQKLDVIEKLKKEQQLPIHILEEVYLTMEDDLWLTSFSWSGTSFNFAGVAMTNPVVADYVRNLERSQYFATPELRSTTRSNIAGQEVRNFSVTANLAVPENLIESHFVK